MNFSYMIKMPNVLNDETKVVSRFLLLPKTLPKSDGRFETRWLRKAKFKRRKCKRWVSLEDGYENVTYDSLWVDTDAEYEAVMDEINSPCRKCNKNPVKCGITKVKYRNGEVIECGGS